MRTTYRMRLLASLDNVRHPWRPTEMLIAVLCNTRNMTFML